MEPEPQRCAAKPALAGKRRTVSVNGAAISRADIGREAQNHPAATPAEAMEAAARALVVRELLLQEARRLAIAAEPAADPAGRRETQEEALIRVLLDREVATPRPDVAACRRYYDQNTGRFRTGDLFEAAHILIPVRPGAEDEAARLAAGILAKLRSDPGAFSALAREHSACPSRTTGGSLGQIGPGQTVAEFEAALCHLPVGEIAPEPVRSRYGLHIVRLDRRIAGKNIPFALVEKKIAAFLADRVRHVAERQYVSLLAGRARIEGIALPAAASPLVQ